MSDSEVLRPPRRKKTGGRKAGTRNKSTQSVAEKLDAMGCDPLVGLANIAMDPETPIEVRVKAFSEIAKYRYPRPKPLDDRDADNQAGDRKLRPITKEEAFQIARDLLALCGSESSSTTCSTLAQDQTNGNRGGHQ